MGLLQEISQCKRSADEAKLLEGILLKAIETKNKDIIAFCKENLYDRYLRDIETAEEFGEINNIVVKELNQI
jgi:hypothetical protein